MASFARTVRILDGDGPERTAPENETLDGGPVIQGFSCRLLALFDGLAHE